MNVLLLQGVQGVQGRGKGGGLMLTAKLDMSNLLDKC